MRESPGGTAEYVRARPLAVGLRVMALHAQVIEPAEVGVPGQQGFPLPVGGAAGPEGAHVLDVVVRGDTRQLGGLDQRVEERGGVRAVDGLGEQPIFPAMLYRT